MNDTILAIATAPGASGVGVIRVSGPDAVAAVAPHFRAADGKPLAEQPARYLAYGRLLGPDGQAVDECLGVRFRAPHSHTGEDVVELHCHGGAFHLRRVLDHLIESARQRLLPLRLARPGEFTQRAFLAGKLDLTRAEAVADLIQAGSDLGREAAARQLQGRLRDGIEELRQGVLALLAGAEAACDFPEEEAQLAPRQAQLAAMDGLLGRMQALLATARSGRLLTQGARVVLLGAPNAGKSSLFNALLDQERAIVSSQPGTTRDYLEARVDVQGFPVLLLDTAGLRPGAAGVEAEGVRRSMELAQGADLRLLLLDSAAPFDPAALRALDHGDSEVLFVLTKGDLPAAWDVTVLRAALRARRAAWAEPAWLHRRVLSVSARLRTGLQPLLARTLDLVLEGRAPQLLEQVLLTQARHEAALRAAHAALGRARAGLGAGVSSDLVAVDLREALDSLGEIIGVVTRAELLDQIFSRFCMGK